MAEKKYSNFQRGGYTGNASELRRAVALACIGACLLTAGTGYAASFAEMITAETKDNWYVRNGYAKIEGNSLVYDFGEESNLSPVYEGTAGWAGIRVVPPAASVQGIQLLQALEINVELKKTGGEASGIQLREPVQFTSAGGAINVKLEGSADLFASGVHLSSGANVSLGKGAIYSQVIHRNEVGTSCSSQGLQVMTNIGASDTTILRFSGGDVTAIAQSQRYDVQADARGINNMNSYVEMGAGAVSAHAAGENGAETVANGILATEGCELHKTQGGIVQALAESDTGAAYAYGVQYYRTGSADGRIVLADGTDIVAEAEGLAFTRADGVLGDGGGFVQIGDGAVTAAARQGSGGVNALANGLYAWNGAAIEAGGGEIDVTASGKGRLRAYGLHTATDNGSVPSLVVGERDIRVATQGGGASGTQVDAIGIFAAAGSIEMAGGSIVARAEQAAADAKLGVYAIDAENSGTQVRLNAAGGRRVQIDGEVRAYGGGTIDLALDTADSFLKGLVTEAGDTVGSIAMTLKNGAVWDNSHNAYNSGKASSVSVLKAENGVIRQNSAGDITVGHFSGSATATYVGRAADGRLIGVADSGALRLQAADVGSHIQMNIDAGAIDTLDTENARTALEAVANQLYYDGKNDGKLTAEAAVNEGRLTPWAAAGMQFVESTGQGTIGGGAIDAYPVLKLGPRATTTMRGVKSAAAAQLMAWREENNSVAKRLGDLRYAPEEAGLWARVFAGKSQYEQSGASYENRYSTVQIGYDRRIKADGWRLGGAVSYTDGDSDFAAGTGENSSAALAIYGTWSGESGHYLDVIAKASRLRSEYAVYSADRSLRSDGDYDAWGGSLSLEYGRRIAREDGWYVEPQAELAWGHVRGERYRTAQGMQVRQQGMDSLVGRLGAAVGRADEKGSFYLKASLAHEFKGKTGVRFSEDGIENWISDDFGDTWCEIGVGGTVRIGAHSYAYADVERTVGADVKAPYRINAGVRWSF